MCITCVLNHMSKSLSIICSRLYEKSNRFCDIFSMNFLMKLKKEQDVFYTQLRNTNSIMGKQRQTLNLNFAGIKTLSLKLFGKSLDRLTKMLIFNQQISHVYRPICFETHCTSEGPFTLKMT